MIKTFNANPLHHTTTNTFSGAHQTAHHSAKTKSHAVTCAPLMTTTITHQNRESYAEDNEIKATTQAKVALHEARITNPNQLAR